MQDHAGEHGSEVCDEQDDCMSRALLANIIGVKRRENARWPALRPMYGGVQ